jgi:hypothetical protein
MNMDGGFLSGGVIILVAAMLWLVYLVPSWVRDSQFSASERNAIRLQQTLRVLAETAEVPEAVRLEATSREVAAQRKLLKQLEARTKATAEAAARVELAEADRIRREEEAKAVQAEAAARAAEDARRAAAAAARAVQRNARAAKLARSRRRSRLLATTVLVASIIGFCSGVTSFLAGGGLVLGVASTVVGLLALSALSRMSRIAHRAVAPVPAVAVTTRRVESALFEYNEPVKAASQAQTWTPTAIPKPLHLSEGSSAAAELAKADAYDRLRQAAMQEAIASRAERLAPAMPTIVRRPEPVAAPQPERVEPQPAPSRFAAMGVVDEGEIAAGGSTLLQRRRAAG